MSLVYKKFFKKVLYIFSLVHFGQKREFNRLFA